MEKSQGGCGSIWRPRGRATQRGANIPRPSIFRSEPAHRVLSMRPRAAYIARGQVQPSGTFPAGGQMVFRPAAGTRLRVLRVLSPVQEQGPQERVRLLSELHLWVFRLYGSNLHSSSTIRASSRGLPRLRQLWGKAGQSVFPIPGIAAIDPSWKNHPTLPWELPCLQKFPERT